MSLKEPTALLELGKPIILKCQSTVHNPEHLYLDGITTVGGVILAPATTGVYTGTHWMPEKITDDTYLLRLAPFNSLPPTKISLKTQKQCTKV